MALVASAGTLGFAAASAKRSRSTPRWREQPQLSAAEAQVEVVEAPDAIEEPERLEEEEEDEEGSEADIPVDEVSEAGGGPTTENKPTFSFESPFAAGAQVGKEKLSLTLENVELVLDELRPYLRKDGGDCAVVGIEGPVLKLEMQGSCSSCSSSAITVKRGIESTLLDRIPEIYEVEAIMPGAKIPDEQGVQEILDGISPFISVSGGTVELVELDLGSGLAAVPYICVGMTGPAQHNRSVRAEVLRRIKFVYGQANVEVIGDEDED